MLAKLGLSKDTVSATIVSLALFFSNKSAFSTMTLLCKNLMYSFKVVLAVVKANSSHCYSNSFVKYNLSFKGGICSLGSVWWHLVAR